MKKTHTELFQDLVLTGWKIRKGYSDDNENQPTSMPSKGTTRVIKTPRASINMLWEMRQIEDAGFVDYYIMAFWIFRHYATSAGIEVWARGAVPSSIVCYCLGLTEVDPVKYGLHSVRFVNDEPPKFQFDIEAPRYEEFMKGAEDLLQASAAEGYDIPAIRECLFKDVKPYEYLSKKQERPLPEIIDDELARYALYFPQTMDLFVAYVNHPNCDFLIYQEEMLDILKEVFRVSSIKANQIRLSIQRRETEQVEAFKKEVFETSDLPEEEKEKAWQRLASNPRAFLKAHAVSRVLASYKYEMKINKSTK